MHLKKIIIFLVVIITSLVLGVNYFSLQCKNSIQEYKKYGKNPIVSLKDIDPSYLLLTPIVPNRPKSTEVGGKVYLTDLFGNTLHEWTVKYSPTYSMLLPNGKLVVLMNKNNSPNSTFAINPVIQELDWDSSVRFEYENSGGIHHGIEYLPNGNFALLIAGDLTEEQQSQITGGIPATFSGHIMKDDSIIEVDPKGNVVWSWRVWGHLNPKDYPIENNESRNEWTHANSVQYLSTNPIDGEEGYIVSFRHISTVIIIRKNDGVIVWSSPKDVFDHQHDASVLPNGNVLVFDNGGYNRETHGSYLGTQVKEINPKTNQVVWSWKNGTTNYEVGSFESTVMGGVQRLKNGSTFIVDGLHGHMFEITNEKKLVWDFINPYEGDVKTGLWPMISVFKARRYRPEDVSFPEKLSPPLPVFPTMCSQLFSKVTIGMFGM